MNRDNLISFTTTSDPSLLLQMCESLLKGELKFIKDDTTAVYISKAAVIADSLNRIHDQFRLIGATDEDQFGNICVSQEP